MSGKLEVKYQYLCHDCGSNCDARSCLLNEIEIDLCGDCIDNWENNANDEE